MRMRALAGAAEHCLGCTVPPDASLISGLWRTPRKMGQRPSLLPAVWLPCVPKTFVFFLLLKFRIPVFTHLSFSPLASLLSPHSFSPSFQRKNDKTSKILSLHPTFW